MSPYDNRDNPSLPSLVGLVLHLVSEQREAQGHLNDIWNEVFLIVVTQDDCVLWNTIQPHFHFESWCCEHYNRWIKWFSSLDPFFFLHSPTKLACDPWNREGYTLKLFYLYFDVVYMFKNKTWGAFLLTKVCAYNPIICSDFFWGFCHLYSAWLYLHCNWKDFRTPISQALIPARSGITNCLQNSDTMRRYMSNYTFELNEMNIILPSDHRLDILNF